MRANLRCLVDKDLQTRMSASDWSEVHASEESTLGDFEGNETNQKAISKTTIHHHGEAVHTFLFLNEEHNQNDDAILKDVGTLLETNDLKTT